MLYNHALVRDMTNLGEKSLPARANPAQHSNSGKQSSGPHSPPLNAIDAAASETALITRGKSQPPQQLLDRMKEKYLKGEGQGEKQGLFSEKKPL